MNDPTDTSKIDRMCCHKTRVAGAPCPIGRDCPYITATGEWREGVKPIGGDYHARSRVEKYCFTYCGDDRCDCIAGEKL